VAAQLLLRLGAVRAVRAAEGAVAVQRDAVQLQLGVRLEDRRAGRAPLSGRRRVALAVDMLKTNSIAFTTLPEYRRIMESGLPDF
jgi:hypothetical protein